MKADVHPDRTAVEAVAACLRSGDKADALQAVTAQINEMREPVEVLAHTVEATASAALFATLTIRLLARAQGRTPQDVFAEIRDSWEAELVDEEQDD